jgi:hypothetical protein
MTIFSAAAAAALEHDPASSTDDGVFAYHAVIKLDVEKNGRNAPRIASVILAKIQLDEPTVVFTDKDTQRIDNDDLLTDKITFDAAFAVTTNRNALYCHLVINSARTFHQIKVLMFGTYCKIITFGSKNHPVRLPKLILFRWAFGSTYTPASPAPEHFIISLLGIFPRIMLTLRW